jgi:hypothetical protein
VRKQELLKPVPDAGKVVISPWICGLIEIAVPEDKKSVRMVIPSLAIAEFLRGVP